MLPSRLAPSSTFWCRYSTPCISVLHKADGNVNFSVEQVAALAPDEASIKAGRGLVNPAKWPTLGQSDDAIWGECQGSGGKPYQISVDRGGPAFKCTCPSRKFPCKHGLGLLFLAAEKPALIKAGDPPSWVADWLASRRTKAERKAATPAARKDAPPDAEAAAKRAAKRLERMRGGGAELARWLADQVRHGLATYPQQPPVYFAGVAARMVDAQAPGLATEIFRLETLIRSGDGWPRRVLGQLGRMYLLTEGLSRFETLPAPLRGDLRATLGWSVEKEDMLADSSPVTDEWQAVGQSFAERDQLWERRTWLLGRACSKPALLLDFSHGHRNFALPLAVGVSFQATLAFYPAAWPLRALLVDAPGQTRPLSGPFSAQPDFASALAIHAEALAANPWLLSYPLAIANVIPVRGRESWRLRDAQGTELPMRISEPDAWELLALSGGQPIHVFGEWSDGALRVLSGWTDGFHNFATTS